MKVLRKWLVLALFILPLVFCPWVRGITTPAKLFWLYLVDIVGLLLWAGMVYREKRVDLAFSPLLLGLFLFLFWGGVGGEIYCT